jgi:hypothetical protein
VNAELFGGEGLSKPDGEVKPMKFLRGLKRSGSFALLGAVMAAAGCGGSDSGPGTGTLSLQITDGAVDSAEHVYIQFSGLELQAGGGGRTTLYYCQDPADPAKTILSQVPCTTPPAPKRLDLLALSGGLAETLLNSFTLPAGHYAWIRLMVDTAGTRDSCIVVGGTEHELTIPSGDETGLKLNRGFDVPDGGSADFTIDFDLRKSVHVTGTGEYLLRPTLRLADNTLAGAIAGTVNAALVPAGCTPAVYVFEGASVTPDDIDGTAPEPVTTATVKLDSGVYKYKAAFLEAGSYTVAYTCQAALDDPAVNDALVFSGTATVAVAAKTTTTHDF